MAGPPLPSTRVRTLPGCAVLLLALSACGAGAPAPAEPTGISAARADSLGREGGFAPGFFNVLSVAAVRHAYSAKNSKSPPALAPLAVNDLVVECSTSGVLGERTVLLTSDGTRLGPGPSGS